MGNLKAIARISAMLILPVLYAATALAQNADQARPGTINYVEGSAAIDGRPIHSRQIGTIEVDPDQTLSTTDGKAEMLLTPGIFFRLGSNSSVKMVKPDLTQTVVSLENGHAMVEVDQIFPQNTVVVLENGKQMQLLKVGLYEFDAAKGGVQVFEGKAVVQEDGGKWASVKDSHELDLAAANDGNLKSHHFDEETAKKDDLYNWSSLRSEYLAQANGQIAGEYADAGFAPGWYWDPGFYGYTYLGLDPFFSPFGWGFYGGGRYGGWYGGRGFYGGRGYYGGHGYYGGRAFAGGGGFGGGGFHGGGGRR